MGVASPAGVPSRAELVRPTDPVRGTIVGYTLERDRVVATIPTRARGGGWQRLRITVLLVTMVRQVNNRRQVRAARTTPDGLYKTIAVKVVEAHLRFPLKEKIIRLRGPEWVVRLLSLTMLNYNR